MLENKNTHSSKQKTPLKDTAVTWESLSVQEQQRVLRVQEQVLQAFDSQVQQESNTPFFQSFAFRFAASFCLVLLFVLPTYSVYFWKQQAKRTQTNQLANKHTQRKQFPTLPKKQQVASLQKAVKLEEKGLWNMQFERGSSAEVERVNQLETKVRLKKGKARFHIVPNKMKRFVVACQDGYKVVVKGTRFTVQQASSWIRVEVTRGKVLVQGAKRLFLSPALQQQGVLIDTKTSEMFSYQIAKQHLISERTRLEWLARKYPARFDFVVRAYLESEKGTLQDKKKFLLNLIDRFVARKQHFEASSTMSLLGQANFASHEQEFFHFLSARYCHQSKKSTEKCLTRYQDHLRKYPSSRWFPVVSFYLLNHQVSYLSWSKAKRKRYVRHFLRRFARSALVQGRARKLLQSLGTKR